MFWTKCILQLFVNQTVAKVSQFGSGGVEEMTILGQNIYQWRQ